MNKNFVISLVVFILSVCLYISSFVSEQFVDFASAITYPINFSVNCAGEVPIPSYKDVYPSVETYVSERFGARSVFSVDRLMLMADVGMQTNSLNLRVFGHILNLNGEESSNVNIIVFANGVVEEWRGL